MEGREHDPNFNRLARQHTVVLRHRGYVGDVWKAQELAREAGMGFASHRSVWRVHVCHNLDRAKPVHRLGDD
jgi:hypothetical protein